MQGAVEALLMMYEVKRRSLAIPITDLRVAKDEETTTGHTCVPKK